MNNEDISLKLQETTDRSLRNEGRIKKLEGESSVLHQLATSVAVMAEQMKTMNTSVSALADEVEELKEKPGKRWDGLVDKVVWAVAAALLSFVITQLGL
jgi:hypothetical protein